MTYRALLTENIHEDAAQTLRGGGISEVERLTKALDEADLIEAVRGLNVLGIRSRTKLTKAAVQAGADLLAVGCFSIGTNQVDLDAARAAALPVFNSPFANSRSVAELTIAAAIFLMRRMPEHMAACQAGGWTKTAANSFEVRAKKLGIVGYGNIGSQLSVLASGLGMHVYYYDLEAKLRHGNSRNVSSLDELLEVSDIVTLHVPSTATTRGMINAASLAKMKKGAVLINYARGDLIDIDALAAALESGHLGGAAVDVFPVEPSGGGDEFRSPLRGLKNVILSPHIGGSTQEAQRAIGLEVADKLVRYVCEGATKGAVNFPEVAMPAIAPGVTRIAHIHENVPGVLSALNDVVSSGALNIVGQSLATSGELGYVVADVEGDAPADLAARAQAIPGSRRVRVLTAEKAPA